MSDVGNAVAYRGIGQALAESECPDEESFSTPDGDNAVGDHNAGKVGAVEECPLPNAGDIGAYHNASQTSAVVERAIPNASDISAHRHAAQVAIGIERTASDAGDWQTINRIWDGYITIGARVAGDGDGVVSVRSVKPLRVEASGYQEAGQQHYCPR